MIEVRKRKALKKKERFVPHFFVMTNEQFFAKTLQTTQQLYSKNTLQYNERNTKVYFISAGKKCTVEFIQNCI